MSKKPLMNPYLPSWEYIPDGEPHVYGDRVYVYGSHDRFGGWAYCLNDYVCWSAPVDDLSDWRYEGVIYRKEQDPRNRDGRQCLFAPDVTQGADGRYYLYYVLNASGVVSVAVCDTPAGHYRFYGYVRDAQGNLIGERPGDLPHFDPAVLTEGGVTYLYTGFCAPQDAARRGSMVTVLGADMLTVIEDTKTLVPSAPYSAGTGFEGHAFFEGSSIRKINGRYYFVYSSINFVELCYAVSDSPTGGFIYGGVIVANDDRGIASYKPADKRMTSGGNNHGGLVKLLDQWYIFYHRHTNGTEFSRQGCIEPVTILPDGRIPQAEMTSCIGTPLPGRGTYPAHIACSIFRDDGAMPGTHAGGRVPMISQDGADGDTEPGYVRDLGDGWLAGYKSFDCLGVTGVSIRTRGYGHGHVTLRLTWDGEVVARFPVTEANIWTDSAVVPVRIPDGLHPLYFGFEGHSAVSILSFTLHTGA